MIIPVPISPKKYPLIQSPLYQLRTRKKLASLLNLPSVADIKKVTCLDNPYRIFEITKNGKSRSVEVPSPRLLPIHNRLFSLLKRIELPDYLHSGTKGRSYVTNAKAHLEGSVTVTLDIQKFYPSVTRAKVASFFRERMACEPDVAAILADITTCDDHIPTGSSISQILAFFACKDMFDCVYDASCAANVKMTCYVDDLTFSGDKVTKTWIHRCIKPIITSYGLRSHKDRYFRPGQVREITGVIVEGSNLKVCNRMHKSIYDTLLSLPEIEDPVLLDKQYKKLIGKLSAAGQIEEGFIKRRKLTVSKRKKSIPIMRRT